MASAGGTGAHARRAAAGGAAGSGHAGRADHPPAGTYRSAGRHRRRSSRAHAARRPPLAGRGDRHRLPRAARSLRRGRHAAGLPGDGGRALYGRRGDGQRRGHGQGRFQGSDARPWAARGPLRLVPPPSVARIARPRPAPGCRGGWRPVGGQAGSPWQQRGHDVGACRRRVGGCPGRGIPLRQQGDRGGLCAERAGARMRRARQRPAARLRARRGDQPPRVVRLRGQVRSRPG